MGVGDLMGSRSGRSLASRLLTPVWLLLTLTVCLVAAGCGDTGDGSVTPVAEGSSTTSQTTSTTTSHTEVADDASDGSGPSSTTATASDDDSDSSQATPTSAPSAERLADGTVVSAGGYEAKTPAIARGMLLEPEWTDEQQEAADVTHQYLDAMIETITDKKPDTEIPTSMTDLERPDLNSGGLVQLDTQNMVRGVTRLDGYWVEPTRAETAFWVSDLASLPDERIQIGLCEYNDFERHRFADGEVLNDEAVSAYWDGQMAKTSAGWRVVGLLRQEAKDGRAGCAG
ncbi:MAG: hypothetical protein KDB24_17935 [Microthrixaceae bacterium]|nr:hypothetical protein [Microthrixaceae bacterium]